jgi:hypothetical protein
VILLLHRAQLWAERLGMSGKAEHTRRLRQQYVCSQHFSETDFTSAGKTHLNNVALPNPCTVIAHPHSAAFSGVFSSSSSSSEENRKIIIPTRTYSRMSQILLIYLQLFPLTCHNQQEPALFQVRSLPWLCE